MIDHNLKCIFVHCEKCAGESIEKAFLGKADNCYEGDPFAGSPNKHANLKYYKQNFPVKYINYFKFTIVRNPYDRFISWVKYRDKRWKLYNGDLNYDVLEYELRKLPFHKANYTNMLNLNGCYKFTRRNELDFIGRFENLEVDFRYIKEKLSLVSDLPHINKSSDEKVHYSTFYNDSLRRNCRRVFKKDLDYFGYEFEQK